MQNPISEIKLLINCKEFTKFILLGFNKFSCELIVKLMILRIIDIINNIIQE